MCGECLHHTRRHHHHHPKKTPHTQRRVQLQKPWPLRLQRFFMSLCRNPPDSPVIPDKSVGLFPESSVTEVSSSEHRVLLLSISAGAPLAFWLAPALRCQSSRGGVEGGMGGWRSSHPFRGTRKWETKSGFQNKSTSDELVLSQPAQNVYIYICIYIKYNIL